MVKEKTPSGVKMTLIRSRIFFLLRPFFGGKNDVHPFALEAGQLVGRAVVFQFFHKTQQKQLAALFEHDGTATKLNVRFHFVAFGKEVFGVAEFELEIMFARLRPKADFFELYFHRVGFQLFFTLFFLVQEFVVVHDPHHRRNGIGGYLHQIKPYFFGPFLESGSGIHPTFNGLTHSLANFFKVVSHKAHFIGANKIVDIVFWRTRAAIERTTAAWARTGRASATGGFRPIRFECQLVVLFGEKKGLAEIAARPLAKVLQK